MKKVLVTGALGQIGTELVLYLRELYGKDNVVASTRRPKEGHILMEDGIFELIDVTNPQSILDVVKKYKIDTIYHLASVLSAVGEKDPQTLWNINMNGLTYILEIAREHDCAVFVPSSIAVFGPGTPFDNTPQDTIMRPTTIYGVSKVAGELLCDYYHLKFGLDVRGLRYPGIISNAALPGGGTTDYAVHVYYDAIKHKKYTCFLKEGTYIDMMYMPDALESAVQLMEADPTRLKHRNAFNVTSMSFAPEHIAAEIRKHIPEFEMDYDVDPVRQGIADSWPNSLDDSAAREEWGWNPRYDLKSMTDDMLKVLSEKLV